LRTDSPVSLRTLGFDTDLLEYRHPAGTYRCTIRHMEGAIFLLTQEGYVDDESTVRMTSFFGKIRHELKARFGLDRFIIINEISKVTGGSVYSKRLLKKTFSEWHGLTVIGVGGSPFVNIVGKILAVLSPSVSILTAPTVENALMLARSIDPTQGKELLPTGEPLHPSLPPLYRERFAQIIDLIGRVTWDESFEMKGYDIPRDDPFFDLFTAIHAMHKDVREMIRRAEAAQKNAEETSRQKDRLIADISHELRSPLTGLLLASDLLLVSHDPQERHRMGEKIRDITVRMSRIVEEILAEAMVGPEAAPEHNKPFDLVRELAPLLDQFAVEASKKGLLFENHLPPEGTLPMRKNLMKVLRVVANLLSNAVKYTDRGAVSFSLSYDDSPANDRVVSIEVADTGIGITPEEQVRLFSRFSLNASTTLRKGTGLGLAIAYELAQQMGGTITVKSAPGKGSVFCFRFPLAAGEPNEEPQEKASFTREKDERQKNPSS